MEKAMMWNRDFARDGNVVDELRPYPNVGGQKAVGCKVAFARVRALVVYLQRPVKTVHKNVRRYEDARVESLGKKKGGGAIIGLGQKSAPPICSSHHNVTSPN